MIDDWMMPGCPTAAAIGAILGLLQIFVHVVHSPPYFARGKLRRYPRRDLQKGSGPAHHVKPVNTGVLLLDIVIVVPVIGILVYVNRHRLKRYWIRSTAFARRLLGRIARRYGGRVTWALSHTSFANVESPFQRLRTALGGPLSATGYLLGATHSMRAYSAQQINIAGLIDLPTTQPRGTTADRTGVLVGKPDDAVGQLLIVSWMHGPLLALRTCRTHC